jgi:carboxylesterase type B
LPPFCCSRIITPNKLTTQAEGSTFAADAGSPDDVCFFFQDNYPYLTDDDTQSILDHYPQVTPRLPLHKSWFATASLAYGEATFICPTVNLLRLITAFTPPDRRRVFAYRYNVQDDVNAAYGLGVPHIFEAAAVFGPGNLGGQAPSASYLTYNAPVVPVVMGYWISFVRALDPSVYRAGGAPVWECWDSGGEGVGRRLKIETGNTCMESVSEGEAARCTFWEGLGRQMRQRKS